MLNQENTIQRLMAGRSNNYDIIRLVAAVAVIFSHSFPLSMGYINGRDPDPLSQLTGHLSIGHLAVMVFFIVSGFLITQSYERSRKPVAYLKARILRIFPGLLFALLLTVFVLGPLLTTHTVQQYFQAKPTYEYFKNITLYFKVYPLPGVFEDNAYPAAVNGSLWTLVYEFKCYLGVLALGMVKLLRKDVVLLLFIASSALTVMGRGGTDMEMLSYFSAGMLFYMFRDKIYLNSIYAMLSTVVAVICLLFYESFFLPVITLCVTYSVMKAVYASKVKINGSKYGDLSYGAYIFAFPIQQTVTYLFEGSMFWWGNFLISAPLTLALAALSWHLVEKNALKLKKLDWPKKPSVAASPVTTGTS
jgi:peptidoglycan/LPS O-acetylase OafA/YrhL